MIKCVIFATISMAIAATAARPRVFYVDSGAGDDAKMGDTLGHAWASLARVNRAELEPGDTVRFKRGGTWRGTLRPHSGEVGAPVTYTAYGDGEKPLLLGSERRDKPADWVNASPDLWVTRKPTWTAVGGEVDLRRSEWSRHHEGGAQVALRAQETPGGAVQIFECEASGSRGNHVQAWGPPVDWKRLGDGDSLLFRFRARSTKPFRIPSISVSRDGPPWTSYATAGAPAAAVTTEWREHQVRLAIQSTGEQPRLHMSFGGAIPAGAAFEFQPLGLVAASSSQERLLSVDVGNIIFDHGRVCGWKRWTADEVKRPYDYLYDGVHGRVFVCLDRNPAEAHASIELALRRHIVDQSGAHDVVYDGLALRYGAAHGFGGGNTRRLVIRNCDLAYIGGGHQLTRPDGKPVRFGNAIEFWGGARDHLVEGCRIWQVYDAALTNQGRGPTSVQENITYCDNVVWNCEYSFEYWNGPETARTRNIHFVHNTCVDAGVVWSHAQRPDPNGSHLMFYSNTADSAGVLVKYNVFYNSTEWGSRYSAGWEPLPDMDYNAWYVPGGELCYFFREHIRGDDVEGYRTKTGLDRHSFFGDPKLVDPDNGDFRLSPDSPARHLRPDGAPIGARKR